jgi:hypothetical protein
MTAEGQATNGRAVSQMTNDDGLSWLPLLEAAMRLGKSTDAVRSLIRRDRVPTRKGNDGRLLVGVPTVDGQATNSPAYRSSRHRFADRNCKEVKDGRGR